RELPRHEDGRLRESQVLAFMLLPATLIVAHDTLCLLEVMQSSLWGPIGALPVAFTSLTIFVRRMVRTSTTLMERTEALHQMHRDLRSTQRKLIQRQQLAAVGELSAVIAHEVRNPLAVIKNAVAGLRRQALRAEDRETLVNILGEETERLTRLMHDLLAYARPVTPRCRPVDARSLLERVVARAVTGGTEIVYTLGEDQTLHGDPELLRHAFVNIVENSVQAMADGGTLSLLVLDETLDLGTGEESCVRVSFQDTGHGMAHEVLSKAPSPFYTTRPSGTGLGLAIVERVLHSHGGILSIESVKGVGTSVHCILPRVHRRPTGAEAPFRARVI
ncbi:MAG: signal transduction histidine kinase, partial [Polyangiales bacterium]